MPRLTKTIRQKLLDNNEGKSIRTYNKQKNFEEERIYSISGGQLHIREIGDTSWSDSKYDDERIASDEEVHRFLYKFLDELNTDGLD